MALQPYADPGQALAAYQANQISPEEQERRKQEVCALLFTFRTVADGKKISHCHSPY